MTEIGFFRSDKVSRELFNLENFCQIVDDASASSKIRAMQILTIIGFISSNKDEFDLKCVCSIKSFGDSIAGKSRDLNQPIKIEHLNLYMVLFYRLVSELDISTPTELAPELTSFLTYVESVYGEVDDRGKLHIDYVKKKMPTIILKNLLSSEGIGYLGRVPKIASEVDAKVSHWETTLAAHVATVDELRTKLDAYGNAFNFVGLHKGFSVLYAKKVVELKVYKRNMLIFGFLIFAVLLFEFFVISYHPQNFNLSAMPFIGSLALISLSMTLLLIYFFRIALKGADSCRSQIIQIDLRKTLCEFVQSYAAYATDIRSKSPEILNKFESIIFSNIALDEDKMISMFEGFEQATNFMKAAKGN